MHHAATLVPQSANGQRGTSDGYLVFDGLIGDKLLDDIVGRPVRLEFIKLQLQLIDAAFVLLVQRLGGRRHYCNGGFNVIVVRPNWNAVG